MQQVNTIMSELLRIIPRYEFEKLEKEHKGNYYTKYFYWLATVNGAVIRPV